MNDEVLRVEGICKNFGGVVAVKDFSMQLSCGEIRGIIGPNGAGKTTIYNLISNIYIRDSGRILINDVDTAGMPQEKVARLGLSRTFQNTRLYSGLSVLDNVKSAIDCTGDYNFIQAYLRTPKMRREEKRIAEEALYCLETAKLGKYANMRPGNLPYGIQRRLEIARALAMRPSVLMLDEPAAGLNPDEMYGLMDFIREIHDSFSLAILVIEHKMDLIMQLCDYIYVQNFGNTIAEGMADEVRNNPLVLEAYLGQEEDDVDAED